MRTLASKYAVTGELGRGGMGVVYQARHRALDTVVAIKVLPAAYAADADTVRRFHQEARVMAQLHHRHIVRVLDVDREGETHYFVMEYIAGQSLRQYLRDHGPLPVPQALTIARQVAQALGYAHRHDPPVIHRDIKPDNILLERHTGRVVVTDFGIAKVVGQSTQTSADVLLGTLLYSAPEQILQDGELDGRADLYSLGLVLYEMITNRPFFAEQDTRALVGRILYGPEDNTPSFPEPIPQEMTALITRAIARDRAHRYADAAEMLRTIDACLALYTGDAYSPRPTAALSAQQQALPPLRPRTLGRDTERTSWRERLRTLGLPLCRAFTRRQVRIVGLCASAVALAAILLGPSHLPNGLPPPQVSPQPQPTGRSTEAEHTVSRSPATPSPPAAEQRLPLPRPYRVTTATAVRDAPTWRGKEIAWLKRQTRIHVVATVGDWLKIESRAHPPNPPGYVWKEDAQSE